MNFRRTFYLALAILALVLILPTGLRALEFSKISDISNISVSKIPPGLISLVDATPVATPVASPESSPVVTPTMPTMDANDYISLTYSQKLQININGLVAKDIHGDATLVFSLKDQSGKDSASLDFTIYSKAAGQYDLRFPEFDDKTLDLQLKVTDSAGERDYSLPSTSRILFKATTVEGWLFDGTATVAPGTLPSEKIEFPAGIFTNVMASPAEFSIHAKGDGTTPPPESPQPSPSPAPNNPIPSPSPPMNGGNNSGGTANDSPLSPPIQVMGQLGGGGRFGCSLPLDGAASNLLDVLAWIVPGLFVAIRTRKS